MPVTFKLSNSTALVCSEGESSVDDVDAGGVDDDEVGEEVGEEEFGDREVGDGGGEDSKGNCCDRDARSDATKTKSALRHESTSSNTTKTLLASFVCRSPRGVVIRTLATKVGKCRAKSCLNASALNLCALTQIGVPSPEPSGPSNCEPRSSTSWLARKEDFPDRGPPVTNWVLNNSVNQTNSANHETPG
jgi:hypothetical protein